VDVWLADNLEPLRTEPSFEEWLSQAPYTQARKAELAAVHNLERGVKVYNKSFIKRETYLKYKPARAINSRHDSFKCFSGPWFHAIEEVVYRRPEFIKHIPVHERPHYMASMFEGTPGPYYVTDYSHFESHFKPDIMEALELRLYKHMLANYPGVYDAIRRALAGTNDCRFKRFNVSLKGTRMSGDMCTSLGNGFSNLMLTMFVVHKKDGHCKTVVEGDDSVSAADVKITKEDFLRLGFDIKIEVHSRLQDTSFCGMLMSSDGTHFSDPRKTLLNFGYTHSQVMFGGPRVTRGLLKAKALSLLYENPRCPVLAALAHSTLGKLGEVDALIVGDTFEIARQQCALRFSGWAVKEFELGVSSVAREDFSRLFGITPARQVELERNFMLGALENTMRAISLAPTLMTPATTIRSTSGLGTTAFSLLGHVILALDQNGLSVLTKMPRDCTAPEYHMMYSPEKPAVSNTVVYSKTRESMEAKIGKRKKEVKPNGTQKPNGRTQRRRRRNRQSRVGMAPLAVAVPVQTGVGARSGANSIVIRHREYVTSVTCSVAFNCNYVSLNPGLSATFPWLSLVSAGYEKYRFRQIRFIYKPQCASTTAGSLWMAIDTDASDPTPSSKAVIASYANAAMGSLWSPLSVQYPIKNMDNMKQWYVRPGYIANTDVKMYDVGNLYFATEGAAAPIPVGDVFVEYTVELLVPQLANPIVSSSANITTGLATLAQPLFNAVNSVINSTVSVDNTSDPAASKIIFSKPGQYLLTGQNYGATGITGGPDFAGSTATTSVIDSIWNAAQTAGQYALLVTVAAVNQYVRMTMTGKAASAANSNVIIGGYASSA